MAKMDFAARILVSVLAVAVSSARAQPIPVSVDGCAELARVVFMEVSAAALYGPSKSGPWVIDSGQGDIAVCSHAAKTVSRAFTAAMMSAGIDVYWEHGSGYRGNFCLSSFLSQCYPNRDSRIFVGYGADTALVQKSWAVVSQTVMREMHNPSSSDEVRFRDAELRLRIGLLLRSIGATDRGAQNNR